jgi:hypothetical protein
MESKKDDPLKGRFLVVRKEIHNRHTDKRKTKVKDADCKMFGPAFNQNHEE